MAFFSKLKRRIYNTSKPSPRNIITAQHLRETPLFTDTPDFDVDSYVNGLDVKPDYDLAQKLRDWRKDGIVLFEDAVPHNHIDLFLNDLENITATSGYDVEIEIRGKRVNLRDTPIDPLSDIGVKFNCLENISFAARQLSLNAFISDFLFHVFQSSPTTLQSLTFWRGSNQPTHVDYPYVCTQTKLGQLAASWIPLEDVHADSGPLAYYPGSHKLDVIPPYDWGHGSMILEEDSKKTPGDIVTYLQKHIKRKKLERRIYTPKKGDLLIWHGLLAHEGSKTVDPTRTRKSYVTHYTGLNTYPPDHMFKDAYNKSKFTTLNNGYVFDKPWTHDVRRLPSWDKHTPKT
ncbi:MAG: phytanoyl-CoA dioxygenase family protein [Maricaulaceae bacterium]